MKKIISAVVGIFVLLVFISGYNNKINIVKKVEPKNVYSKDTIYEAEEYIKLKVTPTIDSINIIIDSSAISDSNSPRAARLTMNLFIDAVTNGTGLFPKAEGGCKNRAVEGGIPQIICIKNARWLRKTF